jgi:hypothetical protein
MTTKSEGKTLNVYQRLAAVMGEVDYIQKEKKNGMNYTIVSHDAVTAKVRPVLLKHGVVYHPIRCEHTHNGNRAECAMTVRFVNIDAPTDFFDVPTFGYGIDTQDKGPGKAMSYAVKYALLKALGLETGDDPEAESVEHKQEDPALPPPPTFNDFLTHITNATTIDGLQAVFAEAWRSSLPKSDKDDIKVAYEQKKAELAKPANLADGFIPPDFSGMDK